MKILRYTTIKFFRLALINDNKSRKCVLKISTLGLSDDNTAKDFLRKAAEFVQPIMEENTWTIGHLAEFLPRNKKLLGLNWNHGDKVEIRLRESGTNLRSVTLSSRYSNT
jgi:hypothetical protein